MDSDIIWLNVVFFVIVASTFSYKNIAGNAVVIDSIHKKTQTPEEGPGKGLGGLP